MFNSYLYKGFENECGFNVPGSQRVLIINRDKLVNVTVLQDKVTALTHTGNWLEFDFADNINYECEPRITRNGLIYDTDVSFNLPVLTATLNKIYDKINDNIVAIVTDNQGLNWLIGHRHPLNTAAYDFGTETQHYEVRFEGNQKTKPALVPDSIMSTLTTEMFAQCGYNMPGIESFFVIKHDFIERLLFDDSGLITSITTTPGYTWNYFTNTDSESLTVGAETTRGGSIYKQEMRFALDKVTLEKNGVVERIAYTALSAIICDNNGKYWLAGYKQPFVMTSTRYGSTSSAYELKLSSTSKTSLIEIDKAYVDSLTRDTKVSTYVLIGYVKNQYVI